MLCACARTLGRFHAQVMFVIKILGIAVVDKLFSSDKELMSHHLAWRMRRGLEFMNFYFVTKWFCPFRPEHFVFFVRESSLSDRLISHLSPDEYDIKRMQNINPICVRPLQNLNVLFPLKFVLRRHYAMGLNNCFIICNSILVFIFPFSLVGANMHLASLWNKNLRGITITSKTKVILPNKENILKII